MSHIVIDAREYSTSTGRYVANLIKYLAKLPDAHGHRYTILLKPSDMDLYIPPDERFTKLSSQFKEFTFEEQLGLLNQIKQLRPDLVHFTKDHFPIMYGGKFVTTMHDLTTMRFKNPNKSWPVVTFKQAVYKQAVKVVAKKSQALITPSEFVKADIINYTHVFASKVTVTYEAADKILDSPDPLPNLQNQKFIMYIGRPTPHKNLGRLIEAFSLLRSDHPNLKLVLAGKTDANYRRAAANLDPALKPNVIFTDFISEAQLRWLYKNCQAYVFPSLSEGFGLPGLEAMVHGAPVVSSNATCLPEIYGDAAHYFDPLSVPGIAKAINQVITDQKLRHALISRGQTQAAKYSWQRMAEQTLSVYDQVLAQR